MKVADIIRVLEEWAPLSLQESYDNSGLLVGEANQEIEKVLISLDVTEQVIDEAIENGCGLIVSHHPLIFSGIKKLTGRNYVERCIMKALRNNIALYAIHTNLDNIRTGVNKMICDKLGVLHPEILDPISGNLKKLIVYVPDIKLSNGSTVPNEVRNALWKAGAGNIGNYENCSFSTSGIGTFKGQNDTNPFIGQPNELTHQEEIKIEVIFPSWQEASIIKHLKEVHPYEEVAYYVIALSNKNEFTGAGMIGNLAEPMDELSFLSLLKTNMQTACIKHTNLLNKPIKKVALCGGSGSFLLSKAIQKGADIFITADYKYHQFFDAEGKIIIADIGHYESEQFTVDLLFNKVRENFPKFAVLKTSLNTNPVNYL
jgi:dinuclear metal center YbgI/SA1388 family protein